jgi:hypothetical protein
MLKGPSPKLAARKGSAAKQPAKNHWIIYIALGCAYHFQFSAARAVDTLWRKLLV